MPNLAPINQGIRTAFRDSPFPTVNDYREYCATVGKSLAEIVAGATQEWQTPYLRVILNDEVIEADAWALTFPKAGDSVAIVLVPQGGGDSIWRTLAMVAVVVVAIVATAYLGPAGVGLMSATQAALVGAAISLVGSLAVNALFPPPTAGFDSSTGGGASSEAETYGFSRQSNTLTPYQAIPRLYGRRKIFPSLASSPYIVAKGATQYLYQIFTAGYGPLKVEDLRIGDNPISSYHDVEFFVHEALTSGDELKICKFDTWQDPYSIYLAKNVAATAQTTDDADSAWVDIQFPQGLAWMNSRDGSRNTENVEFTVEVRPVGGEWVPMTSYAATVEGNARIVVAVSRREWTAISEIYSGDSPKYPTVTELPDSASRANGEKLTKTWYEGSDEWNTGTTYFQDYENHYETAGSSNTLRVEAATQKPFFTTVGLTFPKRGKYEVRVTRTTDDREGRTENPAYDKAYFSAFTSVKNVAPIRPDKPITVVELKIKATEQLNGAVSNFNFVATSKLPVYDGNNWSLKETRNPAWAYLDILRGKAAKRAVADERIDLASFLDWAKYCDQPSLNAPNEPRAACDLMFTNETTVWEALKAVSGTGYAAPADKSGKFSITIDRLRDAPVQVFTPRNIIAFSGEMAYHDQPHALRVQFTPADETVQDEVVVFDDGYSADGAGGTKVATKYETLKLVGISRPSQAYVMGRRAIAQGRLRIETFSLTCDAENLLAGRGSWVRIAHDVPKLAAGWGRIVSVIGSQITLDEDFKVGAGTYFAKIRKANGQQIDARITDVYGNRATLSVQAAAGDLLVYGELEQVTLDCLVKSVRPAEDLKATLELTPYAPAIYRAEVDPIPPYDKNGTKWTGGGTGGSTNGNTTTPGMVTNLLGAVQVNYVDAKPYVDVLLSWNAPSTGGQADSYRVYVYQAGKWEAMGETKELTYQAYKGFQFLDDQGNPIADITGKTLRFAVTGIGLDKSFIPPETAAHTTIVIGNNAPGGTGTLTAVGGVFENILSWNYSTNGFDIANVELWGSKVNDRANALVIAVVPWPTVEYHHVGLEPGIYWYYWCRAVDASGKYSPWFPVSATGGVACKPSDDATYLLDQLFGKINTDQIAAELNKRIDLIDGDPKTPGTIPYRLAMLQGEIDELTNVADYDGNASYKVNDLVKYNGVLYRCQVACKGIVPTNTTYWEKIGEYSSLADAVAGHTQNIKVLTDTTGALSTKVDNVIAKTDSNTAAISNEAYTRATADSALSNQISVISAQTDKNKADILSEASARSNADSAIASQTNQLQARLDTGDYAAVKQTASVTASKVDGLQAKWGVQVDAGGRVAGIQLNASGTGSSSFTVLADNFNVYHPSATGAPTQVFGIGRINGVNAVGIRGNMIVDGSIVSRSLATGTITAASGVIADLAVETLKIANNAVTIPASQQSFDARYGNGGTQVINQLSYYMPFAGSLLVIFNGRQNYDYGPRNTALALYIDGAQIVPINIAGAINDYANVSWSGSLGAGWHTIQIVWHGQDGSVRISNRTLSALGTMK